MEHAPVELAPRAVRDLERLPESLQLRIAEKIRALPDDHRPHGDTVKRLHGFPRPTFRLRVGDYRVVFVLEPGKIVVLRIIHRKELERALDGIRHRLNPPLGS